MHYRVTITEKLTMSKIEKINKNKGLTTKKSHRITKSEEINLTQSRIAMIPDIGQNYIWPIYRRCVVSDQTAITLKDGMITTVQQTKPSMVAGIVGIPSTILEALVPIPLQIRQSQVNNPTAIETSIKTKAEIQKLQSQ